MSVSVVYHDTRLEGLTPTAEAGIITRSVSSTTSLVNFFRTCRDIAGANGGIGTLTIMAHGIEVRRATESGTVNDGGYGILFCREGIDLDTVGLDLRNTAAPDGASDEALGFNLLNGLVDTILLYVCSIADVSPDTMTEDGPMRGDGLELCRRIATAAGCTVIASDELQAYNGEAEFCSTFGGPDDFMCINHRYDCHDEPVEIDFGGWEGTVYTINDQGEVVDIDENPSAWRDSSGTVRDPRESTGPAVPSGMPWYCP